MSYGDFHGNSFLWSKNYLTKGDGKSLLSSNESIHDNLITCQNIKNNLAIFYPLIFDNNEQQDAHEAFIKICDLLDCASKTILFESSQPDDSQAYDSNIKQLFFGILKFTEKCSVCGTTAIKTEPFRNIDIAPSTNTYISNILTSDWSRNTIKKTCQNCKKDVKHLRTTSIYLKPNILVILVKRFNTSTLRTNRISKLNCEFNLEKEIKIPGFQGKLIAYIDHLGATPISGHYISNIEINSSWFSCSDTVITPIEAPLTSKSVYLAFYKCTN